MRFFGVVLILLMVVVAGCTGNTASSIDYTALPPDGDAAHGERLFTHSIDRAPPCAECHNPNSNASPDLTGFGARAGTRVEGEDAREYAFYSITEPGRFVVPGFGNAMYDKYDDKLTPQEVADLIAYLLTL